nr:hypothetical protein [Tanacetum cinerariifolium]
MAVLEYCAKQNMIAYMEKIEENALFHNVYFLSRSSIFYALTVSPDACASFIEQFWKTATFKTINNISQINAKLAGKPVVITEASIRGDILFNDVDGNDCLTNEAIFENLALMGYEGDLTNLLFKKISFLLNESGHISDRAEGSLNLEALSALFTNLSNRVLALETSKDAQAKEILTLKDRIKKLEKKCKPRPTKDDSAKLDVELDEDIEYMDTKEDLNEGRQITVDNAKPDMTLADILIKLKDEKAKGVAFKDSKSIDRPARSILTLKPLPTIDPKDKGKGVLEEPESAKKMTKSDFDEKYTVDERAKLLAEYFERRKKQLVEERAAEIRNKPVTKTQLRRLMMTYLKNMDFVPIGFEEDERMIKDMNKKAEEERSDKGVDSTKKRKEGSRMKRMSKRQKTDVDLEEEEKLKPFLKIDPDEEGIIDYEVLDKRFPIKRIKILSL